MASSGLASRRWKWDGYCNFIFRKSPNHDILHVQINAIIITLSSLDPEDVLSNNVRAAPVPRHGWSSHQEWLGNPLTRGLGQDARGLWDRQIILGHEWCDANKGRHILSVVHFLTVPPTGSNCPSPVDLSVHGARKGSVSFRILFSQCWEFSTFKIIRKVTLWLRSLPGLENNPRRHQQAQWDTHPLAMSSFPPTIMSIYRGQMIYPFTMRTKKWVRGSAKGFLALMCELDL